MKSLFTFSFLFIAVFAYPNRDSTSTGGEGLVIDSTNKPVFRGKLFSDFIGTTDDQPNGLLQTEVFVSFPLIKRGISIFDEKVSIHPFRNILGPDLIFSKIDQKQRYLPVRTFMDSAGVTTRFVNHFDLLQYANLTSSIKLNVLTLKQPSPTTENPSSWFFYADIVGYHFRTGLRDSLRSSIQDVNVNTFGLGYLLQLELNPANSRFEFDLRYQRIWPHLFDEVYQQSRGFQHINSDFSSSPDFINSTQYPADILQVRLAVKPKKEKVAKEVYTQTTTINADGSKTTSPSTLKDIQVEEKDKSNTTFYVRASYINNVFDQSRLYRNGFFQFQFGVDIKLDDFLKFGQKDNSDTSG